MLFSPYSNGKLRYAMKFPLLAGLALYLLVQFSHAQDAKDDLKKMAGAWKVIVDEADGKSLPKEVVEKFDGKLTVEGNKYKAYVGDKLEDEGTIKIDPAKKPKEIDVAPAKEKVMKGLYKIDGDTMTVIFSKPGGDRPKEFKTKEGSGEMLLVYKRIKK
jgi:uncharacterized protein (TIGR03067 family)